MGNGTQARTRDAARSRDALLRAAKELFAQHGYAGTTLRQIGDLAGVDAALVARYFGSKTALYVASLEADDLVAGTGGGGAATGAAVDAAFVRWLLDRSSRLGASPVLQQVVAPAEDPEIREAAARILARRRIEPLADQLRSAGMDDSDLRAEVAIAALAGVALARSAGVLARIADADLDDLVELATQLLAPILES